MPNFRVSNTPPPVWNGGPDSVCAACKFRDERNEWYVVLEGVWAEQGYDLPTGHVDATHPVILCQNHAAELKGILDELMPDDRLPKLQGEVLSAHAARARAEKRAEKAEAALHAMQDWVSETPQTLSPGGK